jgi:hypothetical protein
MMTFKAKHVALVVIKLVIYNECKKMSNTAVYVYTEHYCYYNLFYFCEELATDPLYVKIVG